MGKIIAIGGGNCPDINKEIVKQAGKAKPNLLFIPTASVDDPKYIDFIKEHFGKKLNCIIDTLCLISEKLSIDCIKQKIQSADIIYVGGGNTLKMMNLWRKLGIDKLLIKAFNSNIVMCGVSAGSICWFAKGNSDSRKFRNPNAKLIKVTGLGLINTLNCPHYDSEKDRRPELKEMMKKTSGVAIAVEDNCALQIVNNQFRILTSNKNSNAYKVYWKDNNFYEVLIPAKNEFQDLKYLLNK